jgi:hypothetical protein
MSVPKEFVDGVNQVVGQEAARAMDSISSTYQSVLYGFPPHAAQYGIDSPTWSEHAIAHEAASVDVTADIDISMQMDNSEMDIG